MMSVVYLAAQSVNFIYTIPIGALVYIGSVYLFGGIDRELIIRVGNKLRN